MAFHISCDVDGILSAFTKGVIDWTDVNVPERGFTQDSIIDFDIFAGWGRADLWPAFNASVAKPGWCLGLTVLPGAREFFDKLSELGEVSVVTSPYKNCPFWEEERNEWLRVNFDIQPHKVFHLSDKSNFPADVLIDDATHNVESFHGKTILLDAPYNQGCTTGIRCYSYDEILEAVKEMACLKN